ncbi:Scramblase-domain-containing protein [Tribonema minus]|uniref:Scramblase-domain-containing protein n=1 Tax=Tribonema minus TaxID=303371 RepID=A0A835Z4E1_9STRA|nr:Scramblase-domain-containing protein [Tribonema minus]
MGVYKKNQTMEAKLDDLMKDIEGEGEDEDEDPDNDDSDHEGDAAEDDDGSPEAADDDDAAADSKQEADGDAEQTSEAGSADADASEAAEAEEEADEEEAVVADTNVSKKRSAAEAAATSGEGEAGGDGKKKKLRWRDRKSLYVNQLPYDVTEAEVRQHFEACLGEGEQLVVRFVKHKKTQAFKGVAFLDLPSQQSYTEALKLHQSTVTPAASGAGRVINVRPTKDRSELAQLGLERAAVERSAGALVAAAIADGRMREGDVDARAMDFLKKRSAGALVAAAIADGRIREGGVEARAMDFLKKVIHSKLKNELEELLRAAGAGCERSCSQESLRVRTRCMRWRSLEVPAWTSGAPALPGFSDANPADGTVACEVPLLSLPSLVHKAAGYTRAGAADDAWERHAHAIFNRSHDLHDVMLRPRPRQPRPRSQLRATRPRSALSEQRSASSPTTAAARSCPQAHEISAHAGAHAACPPLPACGALRARQVPHDVALQALTDFADVDKAGVENRASFFMGILLRRYRNPEGPTGKSPAPRNTGRGSGRGRGGSSPIAKNEKRAQGGLDALLSVNQLQIKQQFEALEAALQAVSVGYESNNKYKIFDESGNHLYTAIEDTGCCWRFCCGPKRPFNMNVFDVNNEQVMTMHRRFNCCCCALPGCEEDVRIYSGKHAREDESNENLIAKVTQPTWGGGCHPVINMDAPNGHHELSVTGPCCIGQCCTSTFDVMSTDGATPVGNVVRKIKGIGEVLRKAVSDADNFNITFPQDLKVETKASVIATMFLLDFMFFETGGSAQVNPLDMSMSFHCCSCYLLGCVWPCVVTIGGSGGDGGGAPAGEAMDR